MTDDMIERAAKAATPHLTDELNQPFLEGDPIPPMAYEIARSVIAAMREPTARVLHAMRDTVPVDGHEWEYRDDEAVGHWHAMIDAALAEATPK